MMRVDNFLFVSCPKNATHTLYASLKGKRIGKFHDRSLSSIRSSDTVVGILRNPWDRFVSVYIHEFYDPSTKCYDRRDRLREEGIPLEFPAWLRFALTTPDWPHHGAAYTQTSWYEPLPVSRWIRVETLLSDLQSLGFPLSSLPRRNPSKWPDYSADWDPDLIDLVREHDTLPLSIHSYSPPEISP